MLRKRFAPAAVTDGRFIYIISGQDEKGTLLTSIERFDPETGRSEDFAQLHTGRIWHQAILHDGKLYVLGGSSKANASGQIQAPPQYVDPLRSTDQSSGKAMAMLNKVDASDARDLRETKQHSAKHPHIRPDNSMEIIDLTSRSSVAGAHLLEARAQFGCVALDDDLYVLGGMLFVNDLPSCTNRVQVYSFSSGKWRDGMPMPRPLVTPAVTVGGTFILVAGGYNGLSELDDVAAYNPHSQSWSIQPALCEPTSAHSLAFLGHYLFLFGDYSSPERLLAYDLITKKSQTYTLQYTPARTTAVAVVGEKIYVIGGTVQKDGEPLDCIQVFAPPPRKAGS